MKSRKGGMLSKIFRRRSRANRGVEHPDVKSLSTVNKHLDFVKSEMTGYRQKTNEIAEDLRVKGQSYDHQFETMSERVRNLQSTVDATTDNIYKLLGAIKKQMTIQDQDLKKNIELVYSDLNTFRTCFDVDAETVRNPEFGGPNRFNPSSDSMKVIPLEWIPELKLVLKR